jgi:hypothetical protein
MGLVIVTDLYREGRIYNHRRREKHFYRTQREYDCAIEGIVKLTVEEKSASEKLVERKIAQIP